MYLLIAYLLVTGALALFLLPGFLADLHEPGDDPVWVLVVGYVACVVAWPVMLPVLLKSKGE